MRATEKGPAAERAVLLLIIQNSTCCVYSTGSSARIGVHVGQLKFHGFARILWYGFGRLARLIPVAADAPVVEAVPPLGEGAAHGTLGVLRLGRLLARHHVPAGAAGGSHHVQRAAAAAHRTHDFALKGNCRFVRHLPISHRCTMLNDTVPVETSSGFYFG